MKTYIFTYFKGLAMGAADVVPGVSGGTIAFISGIYERLLNAIKSINFTAVKVLFKQGIDAAWKHIDGTFLVSLFLGIITSILSLAKVISWALEAYPQLLWSFFFGLVLASTVFVAQDINKQAKLEHKRAWTAGTIIAFLIGAAIAFGITLLSPTQAPLSGSSLDYFIYFGAGAVAICAMILPGISGSFILLLMGMYPIILEAASSLKIGILAVFMMGCAVGLLLFSHVLSWLFSNYRAVAMAVLAGFMLGSLNKVWPWQNVLQFRTNSKGEQVPFLYENVMPQSYSQEPYVLYCILLLIVGFFIVFGIEKLSRAANDEAAS